MRGNKEILKLIDDFRGKKMDKGKDNLGFFSVYAKKLKTKKKINKLNNKINKKFILYIII